MTPTLYLTNLASVGAVRRGDARPEVAACVGPGRVVGIMRSPPDYARSMLAGSVVGLMPTRAELAAALRRGAGGDPDAFADYREQLDRRWAWAASAGFYDVGRLTVAVGAEAGADGARRWDGDWWRSDAVVDDGDTLVCVCRRGALCHRQVAATRNRRFVVDPGRGLAGLAGAAGRRRLDRQAGRRPVGRDAPPAARGAHRLRRAADAAGDVSVGLGAERVVAPADGDPATVRAAAPRCWGLGASATAGSHDRPTVYH